MGLTQQEYNDVVRRVKKVWPGVKISPDDICEELGNKIQACYCREDDKIYTRDPDYYKSKGFLAHVLFHELSHRVLTDKGIGRLKPRFLKNRHRVQQLMALEEMIVDICGYILSKEEFNLKPYTQKLHIQYVNNWYDIGNLKSCYGPKRQVSKYITRKIQQILNFLNKEYLLDRVNY
jgi:antirestriction protein ArdC